MAIFYMRVKNISRGSGKSAVAAAAYRAGEKLQSDYDGITSDYTKKTGILHSEIILPAGADESFSDRQTLWNEVEKAEKADNARLAKEFVVAIPKELSQEEQIKLAQNYARKISHDFGVAVDLAIHSGNKSNDFTNTHAHILCTSRPFSNGGLAQFKERKEYALDESGNRIPVLDENGNQKIGARGRKMWKRVKVQDNPLDRQENMERWRANWAYECNMALARNGIDEMIDHRSYARQGVDKVGQFHEGPAATAMRRQGKLTKVARMNEQIQLVNCFRHALYRRPGEPRIEDTWSRGVWKRIEAKERWHNGQKPSVFFEGCIHPAMQMARENLRKHYPNTCSRLNSGDLARVARLFRFERDDEGKAVPIPPPREMEGSLGIDKDWSLMTEFEREEEETKAMLRDI